MPKLLLFDEIHHFDQTMVLDIFEPPKFDGFLALTFESGMSLKKRRKYL